MLALLMDGACAGTNDQLTAAQRAKLSAGRVLVYVSSDGSHGGGSVRAMIDVPVASEDLWRFMQNCRSARRYVSGLVRCRVLERAKNGRWDVREFRLRSWWFLPEIQSVVRSEYVGFRLIRFERAGGNLAGLSGSWTFRPIDRGTRTRLIYQATVATGFVLPGVIVRSMLITDVSVTLKALRKEATRALVAK